MATTIDYAGDYGREAIDYQTTMAENPSGTIDYDMDFLEVKGLWMK